MHDVDNTELTRLEEVIAVLFGPNATLQVTKETIERWLQEPDQFLAEC